MQFQIFPLPSPKLRVPIKKTKSINIETQQLQFLLRFSKKSLMVLKDTVILFRHNLQAIENRRETERILSPFLCHNYYCSFICTSCPASDSISKLFLTKHRLELNRCKIRLVIAWRYAC